MNETVINKTVYKELETHPTYFVGEDGSFLRKKGESFKPLKISYDEKNGNTYALFKNKKGLWRIVRPYMFVARCFVKNPNPAFYDSIGYHDNDPSNICAGNLYWKRRTPVVKLSPEDVRFIKRHIKRGTPNKILADMFGVSDMQISRIKSGENWGTKKYIPKASLPFQVKDGKMRRFLGTFEVEQKKGVKKPFKIVRTNNSDIRIVGIFNGYKFTLQHKNITRAKELTNKLNSYFEL